MKLNYEQMFEYVRETLLERDGEAVSTGLFPFRKRSEHIWRVYTWAKRLLDEERFGAPVSREAALTAAIFHDAGYAKSADASMHAQHSAGIFDEYARAHSFDGDTAGLARMLISEHSNKRRLKDSDTPMELIVLMEADLLDETGALSIVWDCMMEGGQKEQSFDKTYRHIRSYTHMALAVNPMITPRAKEYWADKQTLVKEFLRQFEQDLAQEGRES